MRKTLFKKYMRITTSIILISFLLLGMLLLVFISGYWQNEKQTLLNKNSTSIANLATKFISKDANGAYAIDTDNLQIFVNAYAENIDADIFITDMSGNTVLYSQTNANQSHMTSVPESVINKAVSGGQFTGSVTVDGNYSQLYYVVGIPINVQKEDGSILTFGVVFTASNSNSFNAFRGEVLRMFLFAAMAVFMISFCTIWVFSYRMVLPLREMAVAAKCFGFGDFSRRVPVRNDDEIGELAAAFNNMASSLSVSEGTRRSFIANVSHELKTPMTTIAGFIDGILDGTIPPDRQNHYLKIVSDEVKRLSRLVRSMLDLSRIDNGELKLHMARFDLTDTVLMTLLTFEKKIEEKKLEIRGLENTQSMFVNGDPDMIYQVVYNLIENAVKFTNESGYIDFQILDLPDRHMVRIKNSGQGIAPDEINMVFERFYKTDKSRSQDKNGMGLGLYLVRTIVKLHGGDISVNSIVGEYCEFEFWLPKVNEAVKLRENSKDKEPIQK